MDEPISRAAVEDLIMETDPWWCEGIGMTRAIFEGVKRLPTIDAVPVVRCKDCKHWDKTWTNDWAPDYHYCPMIDGVRKGDFYCADAERRTDE